MSIQPERRKMNLAYTHFNWVCHHQGPKLLHENLWVRPRLGHYVPTTQHQGAVGEDHGNCVHESEFAAGDKDLWLVALTENILEYPQPFGASIFSLLHHETSVASEG